MMTRTLSQRSAASVRCRLDVKRGLREPFVPESFHATYEEAFDAGLIAVNGQCEEALEAPLGWDFQIRDSGLWREKVWAAK